MPQFLVTTASVDQRPLIIRWSVEADRRSGTKPSGKWGATILIASSNGPFPFAMFFCSPSVPPEAFAALLSFRRKTRNLGFLTVPRRLPLRCARGRGGSVSSPTIGRSYLSSVLYRLLAPGGA